jgi:hypothetical membrane protein
VQKGGVLLHARVPQPFLSTNAFEEESVMNARSHKADMDFKSETRELQARSTRQRLLLACGIIGPVIFTVTYLIEGALHPGYDLTRQTISALEGVSNGWTQSANFIVFGLFISCFAVGIRKELAGGIGETWFPLLQGVVALGLVISGIFVHDPIHTIGDFISFTAILIDFFVMARRFAGERHWRGWATYSIMSAILLLVFLISFGIALNRGGPAGLFERLAVLDRSIWSILFTARLLTGIGFTKEVEPNHSCALRSKRLTTRSGDGS